MANPSKRKPIEASRQRPDTNDPFANPVLAALRSRDSYDSSTQPSDEPGVQRLYIGGDWATLGRSEEGAIRLANAVTACLKSEGISVRKFELVGSNTDTHECVIIMEIPDSDQGKIQTALQKIGEASHRLERTVLAQTR